MKSYTLLISFLIFGFVLFQACNKEEQQPVNDDPLCTIIVPNEGQEFIVGETITITINASDADGSIKDISILVNDDQIATLSTSPFEYDWNTNGENPGSFTIKAICTDNQGATGDAETTVTLKEEESTFETYTDPRDGKAYITVKIGEQTWFTENLDFDSAASVKSSKSNYGGYYSWSSAKNACPSGWHLPTDQEWKALEMKMLLLQSEADAIGWRGTVQGMWLKSKDGWKYNGNGTDRFGYNALPAGYKNEDGEIFRFEEDAVFWTATFHGNSESAWYRQMNYGANGIYRSSTSTKARFSVRCIKN